MWWEVWWQALRSSCQDGDQKQRFYILQGPYSEDNKLEVYFDYLVNLGDSELISSIKDQAHIGEQDVHYDSDEKTMPFHNGNYEDDHIEDIGHEDDVLELVVQEKEQGQP